MAKCNKCNSPVDLSASTCKECGAQLAFVPDEFTTLDASERRIKPGDFSMDGNFLVEEDAFDIQETLNVANEPRNLETDHVNSGTVPESDFLKPGIGSADESAGTSATIDDPDSVARQSDNADEGQTIERPQQAKTDQIGRSPTLEYGEGESRGTRRRKVSAGSSQASAGHLKKVWEDAIGSSGRDSRQSLRHERAEASDSLFRRVATRIVAESSDASFELADYQIMDKLGEGGMGVVYSAVQTTVNRIVAIKSIRKDKRESDRSRNQFFYEAEITADLDHPNIPPIYDLGTTDDGVLFYSMKLIEGVEWQKVISEKTREENVEIFKKVSDAVAFAHSKGVIHRDLKPDNVMLGKYGEVYVTDWGLAFNLKRRKSVEFGGTPDYMSPEMAKNRQSKIGKASDIYLLGAILFQALTGSPPHTGRKVLDRLAAAERNEIAPTNVDDALLQIAYRAMATETTDRYASVESMQEAIRQIRQHEESILLSQRADEAVNLAISRKDYDQFTRAIFGYRDAIELWGENQVAIRGLQRARLAFGQCAFDKGDNDLVLHTLDRSNEAESQLYDKAAKAKATVLQREQRFKTLRRTFAAAVLAFLCIATGLAGFASLKWRGEISATQEAIASANQEKQAKEAAELAAIEERNAKMLALQAQQAAEMSAEQEKSAKMLALRAQESAEMSAEEERKAKVLAVNAQEAAEAAAEGERLAKFAAQNRAAQIQLGDYQSKLGLAKLQVEQFDIRGASQLLGTLKAIAPREFGDSIPRFDSWGWQRVNMLTNSDLPRIDLGGQVTAIAFSPDASLGIAGTDNGKVQLLRYQDGRLTIETSVEYPGGNIESVAIAPMGDEVAYCVVEPDKNRLFVWQTQKGSVPTKIEATQNRKFQAIAYSPDASRLIAGINGGIWLWERDQNWPQQPLGKDPLYASNIRGQLTSLGWIDSNTILAIAALNGRSSLFRLDLQADANKRQVEILNAPLEISERLTSALPLPENRLLLGLNDGRMFTGDLIPDSGIDGRLPGLAIGKMSELPRKHRTGIRHMIVNRNGMLLSMSDEPVSHVWRVDPLGVVSYDTYLTGAPSSVGSSNLSQSAFVSDDGIIVVDDQGSAITLNVLRQKQRRQLSRLATTAGEEEYVSPVVGIFSRGQRQEGLSITQDGVVDLWDFQNGKTIEISGSRWSYFGHTPGAELVDSAIDMKSGLVVTSASLKKLTRNERRYLQDPKHNLEFCIWDQGTGNMLRRWTEASEESVEPRLSILETGKQLLISSDSKTRVVDFTGSPVIHKQNLGTYFAIPNPKDPMLTAMVKRSGFTWLWDRRSPDANWENNPPPFVQDDENGDGFPIKAAWSVDGDRLFVVYSNGTIYRYERNDFVPSRIWHRKKIWPVRSELESNETLAYAKFHYDLDLAVSSEGDMVDILYVNVRVPGNRPETRLSVIRFDATKNQAEYMQAESVTKPSTLWLDDSIANQPRLSDQLSRRFQLNQQSRDKVVSKVSFGQHTFVSTRSGKVYDLREDTNRLVSLGRNPLISSTANRDGDILWTLHNDGSLWKLELTEENHGEWKRADWLAMDGIFIGLSPDGKRLAVLSKSNVLTIIDTSTGDSLGEYQDVARMVWDSEDALVGYLDGRMELLRGNTKKLLGKIELGEDSHVQALHVFTESWRDPNVSPKRYLVVHTENDSNGSLDFLPLSGLDDRAELNDGSPQSKIVRQAVSKGVRVATSPTDPIFVTGNESGTVSVWFASPTWDRLGILFDLDGHRGAAIEAAIFSHDGQTLITSDSRQRLLGWLSRDDSSSR